MGPFKQRILAFACVAFTLACGERSGQRAAPSGIVERDSAGVAIVEHTADFIAALPQWTIDSVPLVHIAGDAPNNAFSLIRAVAQRADGRLIVVEGRSKEIRQYSATDVFEQVIARGGKGPGEIEYVDKLQLTPEDSLVVYDSNQRRASVFAPGGAFVRQISYPRFADGSRFAVLGMLGSKRLVGTLKANVGELVATDGPVTRPLYAIVHVTDAPANRDNASSAPTADTVVLVPDLEQYPVAFPSEGKAYPDVDALIFGRKTSIAVLGDGLVVGTNVTSEIDQYRGNALVRRIRTGVQPEPVTDADRDAVRAELTALTANVARPPADKAAILNYLLTQRRIADTYPFNASLTAGTDSTLWVGAPHITAESGREYVVHDAGGRAIAHARFPERIVPHSLSRDRLVGVWLDGDDVPHVMVWKIIPANATAR